MFDFEIAKAQKKIEMGEICFTWKVGRLKPKTLDDRNALHLLGERKSFENEDSVLEISKRHEGVAVCYPLDRP